MKAEQGLVSIADQLDRVFLTPEPEPPPHQRTPNPMKTKVTAVPTRTPINRQAALIVAKPPWWAKLEYDVPDRPPPVVTLEELKAAHRENAELGRTIAELLAANKELREQNQKLQLRLSEAKVARQRVEKALKEIL